MKKCFVCHSEDFKEKYRGLLLECTHCGFVTANMNFNGEDFNRLYGESYFTGEEYSDYESDKEILQYNFNKRVNDLKKYWSGIPVENVLEIGCAYGFFGELLIRNFPDVRYTGIDVAHEALERGKEITGIPLQEADYLLFPAPEKKYSDVFMWDVIEHLPDPDSFIAKIASEISQGGRAHITTGDIKKLMPRLQGRCWRMIHPPTHLHYFSRKTLSHLLENHGFEVIYFSYPPIYRSIKQIFYSLFLLKKKEKRWKLRIYRSISDKRYLKMNTFDIIYLVARKK